MSERPPVNLVKRRFGVDAPGPADSSVSEAAGAAQRFLVDLREQRPGLESNGVPRIAQAKRRKSAKVLEVKYDLLEVRGATGRCMISKLPERSDDILELPSDRLDVGVTKKLHCERLLLRCWRKKLIIGLAPWRVECCVDHLPEVYEQFEGKLVIRPASALDREGRQRDVEFFGRRRDGRGEIEASKSDVAYCFRALAASQAGA